MNKVPAIGLLTVFSATIIFHLLVLAGVIPFDMVWGGRLASEKDMYLFESASLAMNACFLCIVLVKVKALKVNIPGKAINAALWSMMVLFLLNTAGNLFSTNEMETMIFTPVTILLAVLCFLLVRQKEVKASAL